MDTSTHYSVIEDSNCENCPIIYDLLRQRDDHILTLQKQLSLQASVSTRTSYRSLELPTDTVGERDTRKQVPEAKSGS